MTRRGGLSVIVLATVASAAPAHAELVAEQVRIVGRAAPGQPWTDAPTEARLADGAELAAVVMARDGRRRVYVVGAEIAPLVVGRRRVAAAQRRPWSALSGAKLRWSMVEPHAWRQPGVAARNGSPTAFHSNVSTARHDFGRWLGYDEITYFETPAGAWSGEAAAHRRSASARPTRPADDLFGGLGTMRYKLEVRLGDRVLATPGAEAVDRAGILPSVHRVSIRSDDTYVGWLTSYFLVPEVFGSAGSGRNHQTERYTGADCADVLTGALRRQGHRAIWYGNVAGLPRHAAVVAGPVDLDGAGVPAEPVTGVREGDLIRIDYGGLLSGHTPRSWDHVAVLFEDRSDPAGPARGGADGRVDGFDLVVHMGHPRLVVEPLAAQAPARVDVLRWRVRAVPAS
jgi:hypothetical protein